MALPARLGRDLYLRDRARGVLNSAIFVISESLGISGSEKGYSLFGVWGVRGTIFARSFFFERLAFLFFIGLFPRS